MNKSIKVGWFATPRKDCGHLSFKTDDIGKKFKIIEMEHCLVDGGCAGCVGNPIVIKEGAKIKLCGFGTPDSNFEFTIGDWDE